MASEAQFVGATLAENLLDDGGQSGQLSDLARQSHRRIVIAFVGMAFEAKIAAGPGVLVFCRNARSDLETMAVSAAGQGYRGIISFGVAGGLVSHLRAGDWIVASAVLEAQSVVEPTLAWSKRLHMVIDGAHYGPILGVDVPVAEPTMKRELHRTTGAIAVDMESHVVARVAAAHGLAFAAVRVIVDAADRAIPRAALIGLGEGGAANVSAVVRDLVAHPSQLMPLARVAADAFIARNAMVRVRQLLGPHFGVIS